MSERTVYTIRRGADYSFVLASEVGDDTTGYTCSADIKRLPGGINSYTPASTVEDSFAVTSFAGDSDRGPGWTLSLTDTQTLALSPGTYMADALLTYSDSQYITRSWVLQVVDTVTQA